MANLPLIVVLFGITSWSTAMAQEPSQSVLRERYESLQFTLTTVPVELVANVRASCAAGQAPAAITMGRASGFTSEADAADSCPTHLLRLAREGMLLNLYRDMMVTRVRHQVV